MNPPPSLERHRSVAVPDGYEARGTSRARAIVWRDASDWFDAVLAAGATLHSWAATQDDHAEFSGRGRVFSVPAPAEGPDEAKRWAVRHFHRGGAMALPMGDRYMRVGRARPYRELSASMTARARGIDTPAVVCAAVYPDGLYYRADLVTEVVAQACTLADTLLEHDGTRGWLVAMARAGSLIRQLAEAGVYHVDLNARNILLTSDPDPRTWVIDLDRARILEKSSPSSIEKMQVRLTRSIVKIGTPTGEQLRDSEVMAALASPAAG